MSISWKVLIDIQWHANTSSIDWLVYGSYVKYFNQRGWMRHKCVSAIIGLILNCSLGNKLQWNLYNDIREFQRCRLKVWTTLRSNSSHSHPSNMNITSASNRESNDNNKTDYTALATPLRSSKLLSTGFNISDRSQQFYITEVHLSQLAARQPLDKYA